MQRTGIARPDGIPANTPHAAVDAAQIGLAPTRGNPAPLLPVTGILRVLVCRPTHSLGNTLLLTPLLHELEACYPGAEIDIVSRTPVAREIFSRFESVRRVLLLPPHPMRRLPGVLHVLRKIRDRSYDLVIDPTPSSGTARWLLGVAHGRYKLGFARGASRLTHAVALPPSQRHAGKQPVYLLRAATGRADTGPYPTPSLRLDLDERQRGRAALARLLETSGLPAGMPAIGIFANATGDKCLPGRWWIEFIETLAERLPDHAFVEIAPASGCSMLDNRIPTYFSSDLRRLGGLLSALEAFIGTDSGIMHLACASGVPVTGVFVATEPDEWGPYGMRDDVIDARGITPSQAALRVSLRS